ncbi:hypothetical protein NDU88_003084 [Pleurodeles waltl]|uniref:Uncharacterized protein n=1 Tax=Pleurodeles waltl TaxID=8319 RepID=A0AAV7MT94_PLEWA|nr:hypothetical protein NDU88_003084 [Pleurodeles waltl]
MFYCGAWPRVQRWHTPKFLAPEGPTKSRGEACHLRADLSPCAGTELEAGPGRCRAPENVAERAQPAGEETGGLSRLKLCRGPQRDKGGRPESGGGPRSSLPAAPEVLGQPAGAWGSWRGLPLGAVEQCCCWMRARPLFVVGPAREHDA